MFENPTTVRYSFTKRVKHTNVVMYRNLEIALDNCVELDNWRNIALLALNFILRQPGTSRLFLLCLNFDVILFYLESIW